MSESYRLFGYLGIAFQPDGCGVCLNMVNYPEESNLIFYLWYSHIPLFEELKTKTIECMTRLANYIYEQVEEKKSPCSAKIFLVSNNSSTSKILETCKNIRGETKSPIFFYDVKPVAPDAEALAFVASAINSGCTEVEQNIDLNSIQKEIENYKETQKINGLLATLSFSIGECEYQKNLNNGHDRYTASEKMAMVNAAMTAAIAQFRTY
ncbi:hypothetical protein [Scytonema sp. PCC 10023]|uniref:hypothetical protein n=1 Tax=Scytonema sp. PCC 10023 TaxID=1680591 RepID=UPI0039C613B2